MCEFVTPRDMYYPALITDSDGQSRLTAKFSSEKKVWYGTEFAPAFGRLINGIIHCTDEELLSYVRSMAVKGEFVDHRVTYLY